MIHFLPASRAESWYAMDVTLDGRAYRITLAWSDRERRWYFDLSTSEGGRVATGRKLVADTPLLARDVGDLVPPGMLIALDTSHEDGDPDLRELGSRVLLCYVDEADCV
jgi:hypothetical protein